MLWPCLLHTTVQYWIWGSQDQGKTRPWDTKLTHPGEEPRWAAVASVVAYPGSTPGATQITERGPSTMTNLPVPAESPCRSLPDLQSGSTIGQGWRRQGSVIGFERQRGFTPKAPSQWSTRCLYRPCTEPLSTYRPHMLQHTPRGQRPWCREREKQTL